jgi:predicted dehydrogenase
MNVLIIGLGSIARKHIAVLQRLYAERLNLYALRSSKESKNIPNVESVYSWDEVKQSVDLDFILISNPTVKHFETISKAIQFNVPLFIEKPVLHSLENGTQLTEEINSKRIRTYVACNLRFLGCLIYAKSYIEKGVLGKVEEVNAYCGSYLPDWRPNQDFRSVYSSKKDLGGGVHLDLIHELDYIYWIFGKPEKTYSFLSNTSHLQIDAPDYAHYVVQYSDFYTNVTLNYFRRTPKRNLEIVCEKGTLVINLLDNKVFHDNTLLYHDRDKAIQHTYSDQMKYFVDHLESENDFSYNFEQSIEVLKMALSE